MADSAALRMRRYRAHRQGDHHLCRHQPLPALVLPGQPAGQVEAAAGLDPVAEMRALAARLMAAYRADPGNAALARETRLTLLAIGGQDDGGDDELAAILAAMPP
jgi:hypothetical protein